LELSFNRLERRNQCASEHHSFRLWPTGKKTTYTSRDADTAKSSALQALSLERYVIHLLIKLCFVVLFQSFAVLAHPALIGMAVVGMSWQEPDRAAGLGPLGRYSRKQEQQESMMDINQKSR